MRAKGECGDTKLERRREQIRKFDEAIPTVKAGNERFKAQGWIDRSGGHN